MILYVLIFKYSYIGIFYSCILVSKTYTITDAFKYIETTNVNGASTFTYYNLADITDLTGDYVITGKLKGSAMNGLSVALHNENNSTNNKIIRVGFESATATDIVNINNNSTTEYLPSPRTFGQANTDYPFTITRENGVITATINEWTATPSNQPSNLNYIGLESWNRTKTITLTDLVIKPL